jgi:2-hydroxy-6-oxonona-2,4-dienedioate hydrolase
MSMWTDLAAVEFELGYIDAGGIRTRALRAGRGEPVVFLHGTSGHLEAFIRNVPAHAESFRCHAFDMVGHGYSSKPNFPFRIARYVEHVLAYFDAVGIARANLVGESLGGWVAARLAADHPDRVHHLSLLVPGGTLLDPRSMERIKRTITDAVCTGDIALTRERLEGLMYESQGNVTDELVQVRHAIYTQPDFRASLANLLCLQDPTTRAEDMLTDNQLARIIAPTLIVWGRENHLGGVSEGERIHGLIHDSRLEVFENCGHWPQYEHAERFNNVNVAFMME